MHIFISSIKPSALLSAVSTFALCLAAGCSSSSGDDTSATDSGTDGGTDTGTDSGIDGASGIDAGDASTHDASPVEASTLDAANDAATGDASDGATPAMGPARVPLGSSSDPSSVGSYVLLAKSGITNVTGSSITGGSVGLSPAAASFITGFALVPDATNVFATSSSVVAPGKVYASDFAAPTPTNLTTAVLAMQAAYADAAGRTNPDFLNLASGNLGGLTLAPGLYKWGTGVTIPNDVTIAGGADDVWIFQIADDLDESTSKSVTLSGGAQAKNVFWQVAGQVTLHANAHFEGIILCATGITLQTTASMNGRALAQTLIALDDDAVTAP